MLAYFQVFHATRSHFVPILVAQSEQLHQQTTTVSTEWGKCSIPYRLGCNLFMSLLCSWIFCVVLLPPGSFGGTYTSFWLPRRP